MLRIHKMKVRGRGSVGSKMDSYDVPQMDLTATAAAAAAAAATNGHVPDVSRVNGARAVDEPTNGKRSAPFRFTNGVCSAKILPIPPFMITSTKSTESSSGSSEESSGERKGKGRKEKRKGGKKDGKKKGGEGGEEEVQETESREQRKKERSEKEDKDSPLMSSGEFQFFFFNVVVF